MLTYLAIAFVLALLGLIVYGFGFVMRRPSDISEPGKAKCSVCRLSFKHDQLIERQIGDSKVLFFCSSCVQSLYRDLSSTDEKPHV